MPKRITREYDLPHGHNAAKDLDFYNGQDERYGQGLIKMMEWKSPLAKQVLGRSSSYN